MLIFLRSAYNTVLFLLFFALTPGFSFCYAGELAADIQVKSIRGSVKTVNIEKRSIFLQAELGDSEILVPKDAKIFRGSEKVDFSSIEKDDVVTISYFIDRTGSMQILSITLDE